MKRVLTFWVAMLVMTIAVSPAPATAQTETSVTVGAAGTFPTGAAFSGVPLNGLRVGLGLTITGDGSAAGDFQTTLLGTSVLGQPQEIVVEGKASRGSGPAAGTATFSGTCRINMGDGTPWILSIPFTVAVAATADDKGTLTLTLGTNNLPAATITEGSMAIK